MSLRRLRFGVLCLMLCGCRSFHAPEWLAPNDALSTGARQNPVSGDPWVRDEGDVARTEFTKEPVNDPLGLRNVFISDKAREIERNLGVGD